MYYTDVIIIGKSHKRGGRGNFIRRAKRPMTLKQIDTLLTNNINEGLADKITVYIDRKEYATWTR